MKDAEAVLDFWLGDCDEQPPDASRVTRWFAADPEVDAAIRDRFGPLVDIALAGGLADWQRAPRERVSLIVLLDQFPRNLFRGDPRSFAGDARAIELSRQTPEAVLRGLHPIERYFAILPFMHSEALADQRAGEDAYARAAREAAGSFVGFFERGLEFATRHREVIERFGRFPHRNAVLARASTAEERAFLAEKPDGF